MQLLSIRIPAYHLLKLELTAGNLNARQIQYEVESEGVLICKKSQKKGTTGAIPNLKFGYGTVVVLRMHPHLEKPNDEFDVELTRKRIQNGVDRMTWEYSQLGSNDRWTVTAELQPIEYRIKDEAAVTPSGLEKWLSEGWEPIRPRVHYKDKKTLVATQGNTERILFRRPKL